MALTTSTKRRGTEDSMEGQSIALSDSGGQDHSNLKLHCFPLPTELTLEIASYFHNTNVRETEHTPSDNDNEGCNDDENRKALRALSQTSRVLRDICLPLFWARVDALQSRATWGEVKFERLITCLIENSVLAAYVRIFEIFITAIREESIYKLITCLCSLPNMHTLRLCLYDHVFGPAFAEARFPQVRTLIIQGCYASIFVPCCPKVRAVISSHRTQGLSGPLKGLFDESGETLEVLEGFMMSPTTIHYLVKATPNLRIIKLFHWINSDDLSLFKPLKKLHTIEMSVTEHQDFDRRLGPIVDDTLDAWMTTAKQVLTGNEGRHGHVHGGKRIRMSYQWVNPMILDKRSWPLVETRLEDVEVD